MALSLCSFGRSFLGCPSGLPSCRSPSLRRVVRAFRAARRRWPSGRLSVAWSSPLPGVLPRTWSVRWMVDGSCGVLLHPGAH
jgi:hypothetical protein